MSGTAATSTFAGSDVQQENFNFSDRAIVDYLTDNPASLELELQKVRQELAAAHGVIKQVQACTYCGL
jgi:hypothetical protein